MSFVDNDSRAAAAGLQAGMAIVQANGERFDGATLDEAIEFETNCCKTPVRCVVLCCDVMC